jgi:hypothetical protein
MAYVNPKFHLKYKIKDKRAWCSFFLLFIWHQAPKPIDISNRLFPFQRRILTDWKGTIIFPCHDLLFYFSKENKAICFFIV